MLLVYINTRNIKVGKVTLTPDSNIIDNIKHLNIASPSFLKTNTKNFYRNEGFNYIRNVCTNLLLSMDAIPKEDLTRENAKKDLSPQEIEAQFKSIDVIATDDIKTGQGIFKWKIERSEDPKYSYIMVGS
jgi:hypothetical protein